MTNVIFVKAISKGMRSIVVLAASFALVTGCVQERDEPQIVSAETKQAPRLSGPTRMEKDLLGEREIPSEAYYGVQTARALENFQISGIKINHYPGFVEAWALVKLAAARANHD